MAEGLLSTGLPRLVYVIIKLDGVGPVDNRHSIDKSRAPRAYLDQAVVLESFRLFGLQNVVRPNTLKTEILYLSIDMICNYS